MKKLNHYLIAVIISLPVFSVAQNFKTDVNQYLSSSAQVSHVSLSASLKTSLIKERVKATIKNPLINGQTEQLGFMLHADQAITVEELKNVLITPAHEAYDEIQRIPRTITETVKVGVKAYSCLLNPFKWGTCFKDVFETVTKTVIDEVKVRIPAAEAVYKEMLVPVIKIQQAIVPIKGNFSYSVNNKDLDINFTGNKYTVTALFDVGLTTHIFLDHLPKEITPKGSVTGSMQIKVVQSGYFNLLPDGSLQISDPVTALNIEKALGSDFVVDAIEAGSGTTVITPYLTNLIGKKIDEALNKAVKKAIDDNLSKMNIKDKAIALIGQFDKPVVINGYGQIYPNVTKVFVAQPVGLIVNNENVVLVKFGVAFQPFATIQKETININKSSLVSFGTELKESDGIHVSLPVFIDYPFIAGQLTPYIDSFNDKYKNTFFVSNYEIGHLVPSFKENTLHFTADILKRRTATKIGTVAFDCAFAVSEADSTICANVSNVNIKANSLLIFLTKPFIKYAINKQIEKNKCRTLAKDIDKAIFAINNQLTFETLAGTVKGSTKKLSLSEVSAFPNYLLIKLNMDGDLTLQ